MWLGDPTDWDENDKFTCISTIEYIAGIRDRNLQKRLYRYAGMCSRATAEKRLRLSQLTNLTPILRLNEGRMERCMIPPNTQIPKSAITLKDSEKDGRLVFDPPKHRVFEKEKDSGVWISSRIYQCNLVWSGFDSESAVDAKSAAATTASSSIATPIATISHVMMLRFVGGKLCGEPLGLNDDGTKPKTSVVPLMDRRHSLNVPARYVSFGAAAVALELPAIGVSNSGSAMDHKHSSSGVALSPVPSVGLPTLIFHDQTVPKLPPLPTARELIDATESQLDEFAQRSPLCNLFVETLRLNAKELFDRKDLEIHEKTRLGGGAFGTVFLGHFRGMEVAVKRVTPQFSPNSSAANDPSKSTPLLSDPIGAAAKKTVLQHLLPRAVSLPDHTVSVASPPTSATPSQTVSKDSNATACLPSNSTATEAVHAPTVTRAATSLPSSTKAMNPSTATAASTVSPSIVVIDSDVKSDQTSSKSTGKKDRRYGVYEESKPSALSREFDRELKALRAVNHQNVIRLFGAVVEPPSQSIPTEHLLIVMERVPASLANEIGERKQPFGLMQACKAMKQIIAGMDHIHAKHFAHCDLTPNNVLYNPFTNTFKIADLGNSFSIRGLRSLPPMNRYWTSPEYMDLLSGDSPSYIFTRSLTAAQFLMMHDVFMFGLVLCYMLTGDHPIATQTARRVNKHQQHRPTVEDEAKGPDYLEYKAFIRRKMLLMEVNGQYFDARLLPPSYRSLLSCPFTADAQGSIIYEVIRRCLSQIENRPTFAELLSFTKRTMTSSFAPIHC